MVSILIARDVDFGTRFKPKIFDIGNEIIPIFFDETSNGDGFKRREEAFAGDGDERREEETIIEIIEETPKTEISSIPNSIDELLVLVPEGNSDGDGLETLTISIAKDKKIITTEDNPLAYIFVPDFSQLNVVNDNLPRKEAYRKIEFVTSIHYPRYTTAILFLHYDREDNYESPTIEPYKPSAQLPYTFKLDLFDPRLIPIKYSHTEYVPGLTTQIIEEPQIFLISKNLDHDEHSKTQYYGKGAQIFLSSVKPFMAEFPEIDVRLTGSYVKVFNLDDSFEVNSYLEKSDFPESTVHEASILYMEQFTIPEANFPITGRGSVDDTVYVPNKSEIQEQNSDTFEQQSSNIIQFPVQPETKTENNETQKTLQYTPINRELIDKASNDNIQGQYVKKSQIHYEISTGLENVVDFFMEYSERSIKISKTFLHSTYEALKDFYKSKFKQDKKEINTDSETETGVRNSGIKEPPKDSIENIIESEQDQKQESNIVSFPQPGEPPNIKNIESEETSRYTKPLTNKTTNDIFKEKNYQLFQLIYGFSSGLEIIADYTQYLVARSARTIGKIGHLAYESLKTFYLSSKEKIARKRDNAKTSIVEAKNPRDSIDIEPKKDSYAIPMPERLTFPDTKAFSPDIMRDFDTFFSDLEQKLGPGLMGAYLHNNKTGEAYSHNGEKIIKNPCGNKVAAAFAYAYYAQHGLIDLEKENPIQSSLVLGREIFDFPEYGKKNGTIQGKDLVYQMLARSANTPLNQILYLLGDGDEYEGMRRTNELMDHLGLSAIKIRDTHDELKNWDKNVGNPISYARLMDFIKNGDVLEKEYSDMIIGALEDVAGVPDINDHRVLLKPSSWEYGRASIGTVGDISFALIMDEFEDPLYVPTPIKYANGDIRIGNEATDLGRSVLKYGFKGFMEKIQTTFYQKKLDLRHLAA